VSTLRVHPVTADATIAEVQWSGRFYPDGATDAEVIDLFTGIYRDGLDALYKALA
jgi:hypothetical protein